MDLAVARMAKTHILIDLEQRGLLVKKGMGRATRYYPAMDGWAEELR